MPFRLVGQGRPPEVVTFGLRPEWKDEVDHGQHGSRFEGPGDGGKLSSRKREHQVASMIITTNKARSKWCQSYGPGSEFGFGPECQGEHWKEILCRGVTYSDLGFSKRFLVAMWKMNSYMSCSEYNLKIVWLIPWLLTTHWEHGWRYICWQ